MIFPADLLQLFFHGTWGTVTSLNKHTSPTNCNTGTRAFLRFDAVLNLSPEMPSSCKTFAMSFVLMPQLLATFFAHRLCTLSLQTVQTILTWLEWHSLEHRKQFFFWKCSTVINKSIICGHNIFSGSTTHQTTNSSAFLEILWKMPQWTTAFHPFALSNDHYILSY